MNSKSTFSFPITPLLFFQGSIYDSNVSLNKKRAHIDLNEKKSEAYNEDPVGTKKVKGNVNPFTGKTFSQRYYDIVAKRKLLPAWEAREQVQMLVNEYQTIILQGETGSGKTTQVPQFLLETMYKPG